MAREKRIIVRSQGRIQIPKEIREELGIGEGSVLKISVDDGRIILEVVVA